MRYMYKGQSAKPVCIGFSANLYNASGIKVLAGSKGKR